MENKEVKSLKINKFSQIISIFTSLILIIYFFYGFITDENSAGAGGYEGDFKLIWQNLLLLNEDIFQNIGSFEYNDSRPPLSYILHILINPFSNDQFLFRVSTLIISLFVPLLLFFSIKQNYSNLDHNIVLLLSLIITLSPYFRTTAYWGLGENYGLVFLLASHLVYLNFCKNIRTNNEVTNIFLIFILCLLSSLTIYFDQKLIFLPTLIFILILKMQMNIKLKIFTFVFYGLFSLPYIYLIFRWESIIPSSAASAREVGKIFEFYNIGYCLSILGFYIAPFLLCKNFNLLDLKKKIFEKRFLIIFLIFSLYLIFTNVLFDFNLIRNEGKGIFHKLFLIIFENNDLRYFFTILSFFVGLVFVILFFQSKNDLIIILYFLTLSGVTFPFYQEYLDPLFYILIFSFFNVKLKINLKNTYFITIYFLIFSIGSKYYYDLIL